jgi:hypothetical protein
MYASILTVAIRNGGFKSATAAGVTINILPSSSVVVVVCAEMEGTEIGIKNRTNMRTLFAIDELASLAYLDA